MTLTHTHTHTHTYVHILYTYIYIHTYIASTVAPHATTSSVRIQGHASHVLLFSFARSAKVLLFFLHATTSSVRIQGHARPRFTDYKK
jgi:hypothetical protein